MLIEKQDLCYRYLFFWMNGYKGDLQHDDYQFWFGKSSKDSQSHGDYQYDIGSILFLDESQVCSIHMNSGSSH